MFFSSSYKIQELIRISRFPHFWLWTSGLFFWGALLGQKEEGFSTLDKWDTSLLLLFFIFPANVFLNAINDTFDYETDHLNPRKQSLESTVAKNGKNKMLLLSFIALFPLALVIPFVSPIITILMAIWIATILAYNLPPLRLKQYPVFDVIFGGLGHFTLIGIMGYTAATGNLPPLPFVVIISGFTAANHIFGASFDAPYDLRAGILNTTARLRTVENGLLLAALLYLITAVYALSISPWFSIFVLMFPAVILHSIWEGKLEERGVLLFKRYVLTTVIFGFITGTTLSYYQM